MKIVMLNGQNHKGSSYTIGKKIIDKIDGEKEVREFFFPKDLNHFCIGCYNCIEDETSCPFFDEKKVILDALYEADIIIATTPTYCMHVSAPFKAFIDLTFDNWMVHRPVKSMFYKKAVVVSTSAGSSPKRAMKEIEDALFNMGVPSITKYGLSVQAMNWEEISDKKKAMIDKKTTRISKKLSKGNKPGIGIKTKIVFNFMGFLQRSGMGSSPVEYDYWENQGWFNGKRPWKN